MGGSAFNLVGVFVKWKAASAAASAALATITEAGEASKTYVASLFAGLKPTFGAAASAAASAYEDVRSAAADASLFGAAASAAASAYEDVKSAAADASLFGAAASAAASAYEDLKSAAADASSSVVELVRPLLGSDAAAAAKTKLEEVVQLLRAGAPSASTALAAALGTCLDVVPISVRKVVAALSDFGSCLAERAAPSAADHQRSIPGVEELLGFSIRTEVKIVITVISVAVVLYLKFFCSPAGAVAGAMMKAPGGVGLMILRSAFEANPKLYFSILRSAGPAAASARFITATCGVLVFIIYVLLQLRT